MRIGTHVLRNNLFVAPMAGVTDRPFRNLARRFGAGLAVSEMTASNPRLRNTVKSLRRQGHEVDAAELAQLRDQVKGSYDRQMDVRYGAARGWVDAIIDPAETRAALIFCLETVTRCVAEEPYRLGVYQV